MGAGNSLGLARRGAGSRPSGGCSGGSCCQIGEEIGPPPLSPVSSDTTRYDGKLSNRGGRQENALEILGEASYSAPVLAGAFPHGFCRSLYIFGEVRDLQPPRSHMHRPGPTRSIGQETRQEFRSGWREYLLCYAGNTYAAQGRFSCMLTCGGIVVRELFPTRGIRSSTATSGYGRCSRTGAQGTGRFGGAHRTRWWGFTRRTSPHGKVQRPTVVT